MTLQQLREDNTKKLQHKKQKANQLSIIRFLCFASFIYFTVLVLKGDASILQQVLCVVSLVGFLFFIFLHGKAKQSVELCNMVEQAFVELEVRQSEEWDSLPYDKDFKKDSSELSSDLDLFGHHSLYQRLCLANTSYGKHRLKDVIEHGYTTKDEIEEQQVAIEELHNHPAFAMNYTANGLLFSKYEKSTRRKFVIQQDTQDNKPLPMYVQVLRFLLPILTIGSFIWYKIDETKLLLMVVMIGISLLTYAVARLVGKDLAKVYQMSNELSYFYTFLKLVDEEEFTSPYLKKQQQIMREGKLAIDKIVRVPSFLTINNDPLLGTLFNVFTMLHLHLLAYMNNWLSNYNTQIGGWLEAIAQMETMLSFAQMPELYDTCCMPSIVDSDKLELRGEQMQHPLLKASEVVANDFTSDTYGYVVTGSNMSGKTTFIRTIALEMVLLKTGSYVVASSFAASLSNLYTSLRVNDEVKEGISTFYAEILRVKQMMEAKKSGQPMLVLIDEIFKGTNSDDRITCAKEVIRQLNDANCMLFITTHDLEICELAKEEGVSIHNYYFKEEYEQQTILFDYTLRDGISNTRNAKKLMELAGILTPKA